MTITDGASIRRLLSADPLPNSSIGGYTRATDDDVIRQFLQQWPSGAVVLNDHVDCLAREYLRYSPGGWYFLRKDNGAFLLSMDFPKLVDPAVADRIRNSALVAGRELEIPVLPVCELPFSFARNNGEGPISVLEVAAGPQGRPEAVFSMDGKHYLSGWDGQEDPPLYFLCRLPGPVTTIDAARESLKPQSVKDAEAAGLAVVRQGDIFAIKSNLRTFQLKRMGAEILRAPKASTPKRMSIYGTAHMATAVAVLPGNVMLGCGKLIHAPRLRGETRDPDHCARPLGGGWWWLTRNTVPATAGHVDPPPSVFSTGGYGWSWTAWGQSVWAVQQAVMDSISGLV